MSTLPTGELLRRQKLTISDRALTVHTVINNNNNNNNKNNNNAGYVQFIHLKKTISSKHYYNNTIPFVLKNT